MQVGAVFKVHPPEAAQRQAQPPRTGDLRRLVINCRLRDRANPRSEADRGWLQRLVRPYCIALRADISESWNLLSEAVSGEPERLQQ